MPKRIIYTRHKDGGVSICTPTNWIISAMSSGGIWDDQPRGFSDRQIEKMLEGGVRQEVAERYVAAVQFGGCTTAEALEIIRDRDCAPHGTAIELWDWDDVPKDRWFRDAWRRSHNGGPIYINLKLAKPIQLRHIASALHEENLKRRKELRPDLEIDHDKIRASVMRARDEAELRSIWIDK